MAEETEIRHIVRIAGKDIKGQLPLVRALTPLKGLSAPLSSPIPNQASEVLGV